MFAREVRDRAGGMSIDVKKVANLARIAVTEERLAPLSQELEAIVGFVEQLSQVDTKGVEPMTSVVAMTQRFRDDVVTDGDRAEAVLANAPDRVVDFFAVPKVVE